MRLLVVERTCGGKCDALGWLYESTCDAQAVTGVTGTFASTNRLGFSENRGVRCSAGPEAPPAEFDGRHPG